VGRDASIFACLTDAVVAPAGPLPSVRETDAVAAFGRYLERSPAINRVGLRAMLLALELGPLAFGYRRGMRALSAGTRQAYLTRLESSALSFALVVLRSLAHVSYYGDEGVMRLLGYDATANVARGRAVRRAEARW
jgi:hypothetical protein